MVGAGIDVLVRVCRQCCIGIDRLDIFQVFVNVVDVVGFAAGIARVGIRQVERYCRRSHQRIDIDLAAQLFLVFVQRCRILFSAGEAAAVNADRPLVHQHNADLHRIRLRFGDNGSCRGGFCGTVSAGNRCSRRCLAVRIGGFLFFDGGNVAVELYLVLAL